MWADAAPFVVGQIRRVSLALHSAERRPPSGPLSTFQTVSRRLILGNPNPGVGGSQELRAKVKVRGRDVLRVTGTSILIEIAYVRPVLTNLPLLGAEENSVATKRIFLLIAHHAFREAIALVLEK